MNLQEISYLIQLRSYLHEQVNGYTLLKANVNPLGKKIEQIDKYITDQCLNFDVKTLSAVESFVISKIVATSNDADFEKSTQTFLEARKNVVIKDGVATISTEQPINTDAVTAEKKVAEANVEEKKTKPAKKSLVNRLADDKV